MYILITGSSGQIGTNLALRLLDAGHSVFGVDKRLNTWTDRVTTLLQDLAAPYRDFVGGIGGVPYPKCDLVVHLAANAKVHELVQYPHRAMENIALTFNVLEYCRHNQLPLIFSSSREVYGDIHRYITEEQQADFSFTESPYSASKVAGEALVYAYARCYDLRYLVFRFSNVYGRYDNDLHRMERVIPLFLQRIAAGEPITVYGRNKMLDFTYVDDCVAGVHLGIEALVDGKFVNETINLAYGQGNTLYDLVNLLQLALGRSVDVTWEPARVGEVTRYIADVSKARRLLGYDPQVPLSAGISLYIEWSREKGFLTS